LIEVKCKPLQAVIRARWICAMTCPEYASGDVPSSYYCRKVLIGEKQCFQQIDVVLKFDGKRKLIDQVVTGGRLWNE
jgi:hypothetical protein